MRERDSLSHELSVLSAEPDQPSFEIIGTDDRVRVADTTVAPYRWICFIELKYTDKDDPRKHTTTYGTGTLVSPRHVLTSAHLFHALMAGHHPYKFKVWPGRDGSTQPYGVVGESAWRISKRYASSRRKGDDYALITLDRAVDARTAGGGLPALGYWGSDASSSMAWRDPSAVIGQDINIAGYPGDKSLGTPWRASGTATIDVARNLRLVDHTADATRGMSGAPIWIDEPSGPVLIGVHSGGGTITITGSTSAFTSNTAARLTRAALKEIRGWIGP